MPRVAMIQSCYIPWKGFFDIVNAVDTFVLYEDAQYTRRDWRSRNKIKTPQGLLWLSVPIQVAGAFTQRVRDAVVSDDAWRANHWRNIEQNYRKAPFFAEYAPRVRSYYLDSDEKRLSYINRAFLELVCELLDIKTKIVWSWDLDLGDGRSEKLLRACQQLGATEYLSGPSARDYLDVAQFHASGVRVGWMNYEGYPEYPQFHPPFEHGVSVLDTLFHLGPATREHMKSFAGPAPIDHDPLPFPA